MNNIIGLKELRTNVDSFITQVRKGKSFIVVRRARPVFKISPPEDTDAWETIVDFTEIKKGGIPLRDVLWRL